MCCNARSRCPRPCQFVAQSFQQNRHFSFLAHVYTAKAVGISLISRLVACSARIVVQTDTQTVTLAAHARRGYHWLVLREQPSRVNVTQPSRVNVVTDTQPSRVEGSYSCNKDQNSGRVHALVEKALSCHN